MSANEQADVVVVGLGPGGEYVAGTLRSGTGGGGGRGGTRRRRVSVLGMCAQQDADPGWESARQAGRVPALAGEAVVSPDWARVAGRIRDEATDDWNDQVAADRITAKGGRLVQRTGRLAGPHRVTVGDRTLEGPARCRAGHRRLLMAGLVAVVTVPRR
jgi:pyruvate/2-oxoglutarate dehydrogenase complex dihydrolipoamide dehydrogenase (E3) component